ncbi:glycosyltransferase family 4 protein [Tenacibaculum ovolyticum]|uniref:glycosyltransferase family 4 protein n=1 Tax=Tenacibaculum ovolyticum TaxID=104270 RepID=UPI0018D28358|nr:glycosyltransferase family 4 protein [Tenacibaculum ovolyticum]
MKDKNILIASCVFPPEPVVSATISFDLANHLAKDNTVTVISPKPTRPEGYNFDDNPVDKNREFKHVVVNSYTSAKSKIIPRFYESYSLGKHIAKYIKKNKGNIDVVYINSWPLASQYLIVKACKKLNIETVVHIQDIYPETLTNKLPVLKSFFHKLLLPLDKYILKNPRTVVTISSGMKKHLVDTRNLEEKSIKIVYNWQNTKKVAAASKENEFFTYVYLGSLSPSAQIESIIEGFGALNNSKAKLIIAGSGSDDEKLKKIAADYPDANIEFTLAPSDKVAEIQAKADVLVLSLREGVGKIALPSKLVSYMFSKKPILAIVESDCDIEKIILDADCGWVVKQNQQEDIKNKMAELIKTDPKILLEKGERSEVYAIQNLSREVNLEKLSKIITNDL